MTATPDPHASREQGAEPVRRRPYSATSGVLLAAVPVPWATAAWALGGIDPQLPLVVWLALGITTAALLAAGLTISVAPRIGRTLATIGALGVPALAVPRIAESPALALLLVTATTLGLATLWQFGAPLLAPPLHRDRPGAGRVRGSAALALVFWLVVGIARGHTTFDGSVPVGLSMLVALANGIVWLVRTRSATRPRARVLLVGLSASALLALTARSDVWSVVSCGAVYALAAAVFGPRSDRPDEDPWWSLLLEHPERLLVTTFATMAAIGTVVLALPQSATDEASIGGVDALFTAVSAVCVTGLIVRDTPHDFTLLGQLAILALIQLGALGIMTFSTAALRVLGARMSLRQEAAVARLIGARDRSRLITSAQDVLRVTFLAEATGAVVLTGLFVLHGDDFGMACWRGVFTSVSAFCNAGFALQTDSLVPYRDSPAILHTVALLVILGGLSPAVVLALRRGFDRARPWSAQVRLCVVAAAILLVGGFAFFLVVEWNQSLADLSIAGKVHNAWFLSVTLRTAGFNSTDLGIVSPGAYVAMLVLMFIGASPGGTAGGIKTTTAAVLLLSVLATIRGRDRLVVFGRHVPDDTVRRAAVVVTVAVLSGMTAVLAVLLTQPLPITEAVFEVVSALGTVGLSQGATSSLDDVGKLIVTVCMFVGRIGGLSIMMFVSQSTLTAKIRHPRESIDIG
jgi:trk system potassium uptake protein TrkH